MNVIILIGILLLVNIFLLLNVVIENNICKKKCTLKVKGKIVDIWNEEKYYGHFIRGKNPHDIFRTLILIEYKYNNKTYSIIKRVSFLKKYRVFDDVELTINPNEPEEVGSYKVYIKPKEITKTNKNMKIIILSALICYIIFYVMIFTIKLIII